MDRVVAGPVQSGARQESAPTPGAVLQVEGGRRRLPDPTARLWPPKVPGKLVPVLSSRNVDTGARARRSYDRIVDGTKPLAPGRRLACAVPAGLHRPAEAAGQGPPGPDARHGHT